MISRSVYKIPSGKLLKISLEYNDKSNVIENIKIMGDFFAYPEEAIDFLENGLKDTKLEKNLIFNKIKAIIKENNFKFIGLDPEGLTHGILMCLK